MTVGVHPAYTTAPPMWVSLRFTPGVSALPEPGGTPSGGGYTYRPRRRSVDGSSGEVFLQYGGYGGYIGGLEHQRVGGGWDI
jgi:hypothetical protein